MVGKQVRAIIGFPWYLKSGRSTATFYKSKWRKAKKQLPQDTRMHKIEPRCSQTQLKVESYGGLMLRCWVEFPGKELGHATLTVLLWVHAASTDGYRTNSECFFCFLPCFVKVKIPFGFPLVSKNRYWGGSSVNTKWWKQTFEKWGIPVTLGALEKTCSS